MDGLDDVDDVLELDEGAARILQKWQGKKGGRIRSEMASEEDSVQHIAEPAKAPSEPPSEAPGSPSETTVQEPPPDFVQSDAEEIEVDVMAEPPRKRGKGKKEVGLNYVVHDLFTLTGMSSS